MKIPLKLKQIPIELFFLILVSIVAWQGLHRTPTIRSDVYPYLTSISPDLVKQCIQENKASPTIIFEQLLAIRSTLPENDAQPLINQLKTNVSYTNLDWGLIPDTMRKYILRHKEILHQYPYYHPNNYSFPVIGTIWFNDSFGADREGGKRKHEGTDLFGNEGTPIVSICAGEVEQLGWNRLGGERVGVRGDDGNYYYYAHLQYISTALVKGHRVLAGELLGSMGHTGVALTTPDHLHFGIELPNGEWINPYPFLEAWKYADELQRIVTDG